MPPRSIRRRGVPQDFPSARPTIDITRARNFRSRCRTPLRIDSALELARTHRYGLPMWQSPIPYLLPILFFFTIPVLLFAYLLIGAWRMTRILKSSNEPAHQEWMKLSEEITSGEKILDALEQQLRQEPGNIRLRVGLMHHYMFAGDHHTDQKAREAAQAHTTWLIEHAPESPYCGNPIASAPFPGNQDEGMPANLTALWQRALETTDDLVSVLSNAADFATTIDRPFAKKCAQRLFDLEPLNPSWQELLGRFYELDIGRERTAEDQKNAQASLKYYESALAFRWDSRHYAEFRALRRSFAGFFYPAMVAPLLLRFRTRLEKQPRGKKKGFSDFQLVAKAATMAWESGDSQKAKYYSQELKELLPEAEATVTWPPFLQESYNILARMALARNDLTELKVYLAKKEKNPASSVWNFVFDDFSILADMIKAGHGDMVIEYIQRRAEKMLPDPEIEFQIDLVRRGEVPFDRKFLPEESKESD